MLFFLLRASTKKKKKKKIDPDKIKQPRRLVLQLFYLLIYFKTRNFYPYYPLSFYFSVTVITQIFFPSQKVSARVKLKSPSQALRLLQWGGGRGREKRLSERDGGERNGKGRRRVSHQAACTNACVQVQ